LLISLSFKENALKVPESAKTTSVFILVPFPVF
jgi:hypothetical protein